jgi:hypothetical protein
MGTTLTCTKGTIPDQLSSNTKRTGHTEEHSVELHLVESVVRQENTRVGVNVGPWVLSLASLYIDED